MLSEDMVRGELRRIWERHLGVPVDDVDEDFFELGGDSLLALVVATEANEAGLPMPLSAVLRRGTLRRLAEAVVDQRLFGAD